MNRQIGSFLLWTSILSLFATAGYAQSNAGRDFRTRVAWVYVTSSPANGVYQINAYAAYSNGELESLSGPFSTPGSYLAANGNWLFDTDGTNIYSYQVKSDGGLTKGPQVDAQKYNPDPNSGGPVTLFQDRRRQFLYDGDFYADGANNGYQSWQIVETSGELEYTGITNLNVEVYQPLSFTGDNEYAYGSNCVKGFQSIFGYHRNRDGSLTVINQNPYIPPTNISGSAYCPYLAAADQANHVAISLTPFEPYQDTGPPQIAVYTANSSGDLTTTSNALNMPASEVVNVTDMKMSPSGTLLAVGGTGGLQVFHFHGANPVTTFTGLLTTDGIKQMFWDHDHHLYAISVSTGKLFVFTITDTGAAAAPGSPYRITNPQYLAVSPEFLHGSF